MKTCCQDVELWTAGCRIFIQNWKIKLARLQLWKATMSRRKDLSRYFGWARTFTEDQECWNYEWYEKCRRNEAISGDDKSILDYEASLKGNKLNIMEKEDEVGWLMADCNLIVQEQAEVAHAKRMKPEDALIEAKDSLEQQLDIDWYVLIARGHSLAWRKFPFKNQIDETDLKIVLVAHEEKNWQLRRSLGRA